MTDEGNGWWKYTLAGVSCSNLIFNNNGSPQTADLYRCGDSWYDNGWVPAPTAKATLQQPLLTTQKRVAFNVFPNPARQQVYVYSTTAKPGMYTIYLKDLSGKTVYTTKADISTAAPALVQLSNTLAPGMYMIQMVNHKDFNSGYHKLVIR